MTIRTQSLYFKSGRERLFGWLHLPEGRRSNVGIVMCKPFGYEAVCTDRSWRTFANEFAELGFPVIRFDFSGTGDSSGDGPSPACITEWVDDVLAAMDALRSHSGIEKFCLFGMRLGALLAARAAERCDGVQAFIAIAPVIDGRKYVRELRTLGVAEADSSLEVAGFALPGPALQALSQLTAEPEKLARIGHFLILDRNDLPGAGQWAESVAARGPAVRYLTTRGYLELTFTPHAAHIPAVMRDEILAWLRERMGPTAVAPGSAKEVPEVLTIPGEGGRGVLERALCLDADAALFGILSEPQQRHATAGAAPRGVVLLNAGATSHIGPNRMYVKLARRWALEGNVVLRLDLAGIGDSSTRPDRPDNEVYPPGAVDDIARAIEYLRRTHGVDHISLVGLCAGAYHALRASLSLAVQRVLMINPATFHWKEGMTMNDLQIAEVVANPGVYRERLWSLSAWRRVLLGRVNLWRVMMVFVRRAGLGAEMVLRRLGKYLGLRMPNDLAADLRDIAARGVHMIFIFARGEAGAELLRIQGGSAVQQLKSACAVHFIDGADHIFTQSGPRDELEELLSAEVSR